MKRSSPVLLDQPREFRPDEVFFSCTDLRGIIVACNPVFVRISAYQEEELIGRPHNLIRHPDMPRAVFRLFWSELQAGRPIAAYVKNLAKDGRYYWVLALAAPLAAGGYLSIRFKPSSRLHPEIEALYREMRSLEQDAEAAGASKDAVMQVAAEKLAEVLKAKGFEDYSAFMRTALLREELKSRDALLTAESRSIFPALPETVRTASTGLPAALGNAYLEGQKTYERLNGLYSRLDELARLNEDLRSRSHKILNLTADFSIVAFNVALKAGKLGHEGRGIDVVARFLGDSAGRIGDIVHGLGDRIAAVSVKLGEVIFGLSWARLQFEMTLLNYQELATGSMSGKSDAERLGPVTSLQSAFRTTGEQAVQALRSLADELSGLDANAEELRRIITALQVAQVSGLVEISRLMDNDGFAGIFAEVKDLIENSKHELEQLNDATSRLGVFATNIPETAGLLADASDRFEHDRHNFETAAAVTVGAFSPSLHGGDSEVAPALSAAE